MTTPIIRPENGADAPAIFAVTKAAFGKPDVAKIVDALRSDGALTLSLVADLAGKIVGHVAVSPVLIGAARDSRWLQLSPLSVFPHHQRQGIGAALVKQLLADAADLGWDGIVLLGDPKYYGRFGFQLASNFGLMREAGGGKYFQALRLSTSPIPAGEVTFHPAFDNA